jgi:hypothetical protein
MSAKSDLLTEFELFRGNGGGIEAWFSERIPDKVVEVLINCEKRPISCEVLSQLLILSHEGGVSKGFFDFYFLTDPHAEGYSWYDPKKLPEFEERFLNAKELLSLKHLKWGLRRFYIDALLSFGNIRQAFRALRNERHKADVLYRTSKCAFKTKEMTSRGAGLPLEQIARDDRYLIAEIACKTYDPADSDLPNLTDFMKERFKQQSAAGNKSITVRDLVSSASGQGQESYTSEQLSFSLDEVLDRKIGSEDEISTAIEPIHWPAPGSEDTELGVLMELEVDHGETEVHARVQA